MPRRSIRAILEKRDKSGKINSEYTQSYSFHKERAAQSQ